MQPLKRAAAALALLALPALAADMPPVEEVVRQAFEADVENEALARQYTFRQHTIERKLDRDHNVKETESKTHEVLFLFDEEYERLIAENGNPLPPDKQAKEQKKIDKRLEELSNESPKQREKRLAKQREEEEDRKRFAQEVTRTFDFTLEGSETVAGAEAFRIRAEPKPGYEPEFKKVRFLSKIRGLIWIAKKDYAVLKAEMDVIDNVSFGLFLLKLKEGAEVEFQNIRVNDEVWMLDELTFRFDAKVAALKTLRREIVLTWSDFQKFTAESKILPAE